MASLHLIDPDGDVELLVRPEVEPLVHQDITITPSPPDLEYRRGMTLKFKKSKKKKEGRAFTGSRTGSGGGTRAGTRTRTI